MTCQIRFSFSIAFGTLEILLYAAFFGHPSKLCAAKTARAGVPALLQTRRRLGGRQPLCGIGVTSLMCTMCNPAEARARTADSRPEPGPFTRTSIDFMPYWSRATPAAATEACWAAYGVPLREPLKPMDPAEDQETARPSGPQMVIIVLLKVAWMC